MLWERLCLGPSERRHGRSGEPGSALPDATLESIARTGLVLKGPLTTPVGKGFRSINVTLRQQFDLYANVRPTQTIVPGGRYENVDLVVIRENVEGLYAAMEHYMRVGDDPEAVAYGAGFNTRAECNRIVRFAFEYAVKNGRKKVTLVHKANILKILSGIFLHEGRRVAAEYEGRVELEERIVDACAMELVIKPENYDVLVTTNLLAISCLIWLRGLSVDWVWHQARTLARKWLFLKPFMAQHLTLQVRALLIRSH